MEFTQLGNKNVLISSSLCKTNDIGKHCIVLQLTQMGRSSKKVGWPTDHLHWLVDSCISIVNVVNPYLDWYRCHSKLRMFLMYLYPFQLLEYQIWWVEWLIWYSREIGLCPPRTGDTPPNGGGSPSSGGRGVEALPHLLHRRMGTLIPIQRWKKVWKRAETNFPRVSD